MEQKPITQQEKTAKELRAEERLKRAKADLAKIRRDKKSELRKAQESHKFMMGGCEKEFVKKGMCVQFAIHDSVNKKTGQRRVNFLVR